MGKLVLPKITTILLSFLLLLSASYSSISWDLCKGKRFVLWQQIFMLNDFVFSADSCPVLTTVRAEYCKIFFLLICMQEFFSRLCLELPTLNRFTPLNSLSSVFFKCCRKSEAISRGKNKMFCRYVQEDSVGKFTILWHLAFSRHSINLCKQGIEVIPGQNRLVTLKVGERSFRRKEIVLLHLCFDWDIVEPVFVLTCALAL